MLTTKRAKSTINNHFKSSELSKNQKLLTLLHKHELSATDYSYQPTLVEPLQYNG